LSISYSFDKFEEIKKAKEMGKKVRNEKKNYFDVESTKNLKFDLEDL
jgi:hypothetical protein